MIFCVGTICEKEEEEEKEKCEYKHESSNDDACNVETWRGAFDKRARYVACDGVKFVDVVPWYDDGFESLNELRLE